MAAEHGRADGPEYGSLVGVLPQAGDRDPEGSEEKPFVRKRMESGVSIFWDTVFAHKYDPDRERPKGDYQVMLEFFLEDEEAVDSKYEELTRHGYGGRLAPVRTFGPYAAMVDDPDGNVVLLTAG